MKLREDEESPIILTDKAIEQVKEAMKADNVEDQALRVFVQGGGCSGFQFGLDFAMPTEFDLEMEMNGLTVIVDPISCSHLEGTTIDYVLGISGAGFKFNNPYASKSCGCGQSFS